MLRRGGSLGRRVSCHLYFRRVAKSLSERFTCYLPKFVPTCDNPMRLEAAKFIRLPADLIGEASWVLMSSTLSITYYAAKLSCQYDVFQRTRIGRARQLVDVMTLLPQIHGRDGWRRIQRGRQGGDRGGVRRAARDRPAEEPRLRGQHRGPGNAGMRELLRCLDA